MRTYKVYITYNTENDRAEYIVPLLSSKLKSELSKQSGRNNIEIISDFDVKSETGFIDQNRQTALDQCNVFLVVVDEKWHETVKITDRWEYYSVKQAINKRKTVIPIYLPDVQVKREALPNKIQSFVDLGVVKLYNEFIDDGIRIIAHKIIKSTINDKPFPCFIFAAMFLILLIFLFTIFLLFINNKSNETILESDETIISQRRVPPSATLTPTKISAANQLETAQVRQTQAISTAQVLAQTATADRLSSNFTATATAQMLATETSAQNTLIALSATPTPTLTLTVTQSPTQDTLQARLNTWERDSSDNSNWEPYSIDVNDIEMVLVPYGCTMIGSNNPGESPATRVCFNSNFWVSKHEITNAQYGSVGNCSNRSSGPNSPRNCVTWQEAYNFCKTRLNDGRLLTEAEWEYVARGPSGLIYPWGNIFEPDNAVYKDTPVLGNNRTAPVGSYSPLGDSWVGTTDMSGNLAEWTNSLYESYPYEEIPFDANSARSRVVRGGSWQGEADLLRGSSRRELSPNNNFNYVGFRCMMPYIP